MDSCMTSPRWPVIVNCFPPRILLASMKTMSPPTGVQTSPTETPGFCTRSSTSFSRRNFVNHVGRNDELVRLAFGDPTRLFAHECGDFALEIPDARLARVVMDQIVQR